MEVLQRVGGKSIANCYHFCQLASFIICSLFLSLTIHCMYLQTKVEKNSSHVIIGRRMKTNTRQKQKIRLGEYFQGEKYDHPAWKNNECHAKSSSGGSRSSLSLKIAKKADPSLDLLLIHHVKEESHFCFGQTAGEWRYQNTNSKDCEVNLAYPKMIDSKKVLRQVYQIRIRLCQVKPARFISLCSTSTQRRVRFLCCISTQNKYFRIFKRIWLRDL